jgi:crossover junction endodeoxyribonuclease RuvC
MINIGIDPGVGGGVAVIENGYIEAFNCHDTVKDMADYINKHRWDCINMFCVIEKVHSMPKQGVVSTFTFGKNYGQWLGILASNGVPYKEVTPQTWMKYYGAMPKDKPKRKKYLKHLAQSLYPNIKITLKTADAVLIAHWCRQIAPDISDSPVGAGFIKK